jgi:hypothetical protein
MFEKLFCFAGPKATGWDGGGVPFFFFFLISGHERSERKGSSIPQGHHARPVIFLLLLFCQPRFLQIWEGGRAAFDFCFLISC